MIFIALLVIVGSLTTSYTLAKKQNSINMAKYVCDVCGKMKWDVTNGVCQECVHKNEE